MAITETMAVGAPVPAPDAPVPVRAPAQAEEEQAAVKRTSIILRKYWGRTRRNGKNRTGKTVTGVRN